jgi:hypothetical protein
MDPPMQGEGLMTRLVHTLATTSWLALGIAALALGGTAARAQEDAGVTAAVNPQATGTAPAALPKLLEVGGNVVQNEHITTGDEGQLQLLFHDGSTMALGPNGDLTIDNFVYDPNAKTAKLAMTAASGAFRFIGGRASKDEPVILKTPTATIGIRGGGMTGNAGASGTEVSFLNGVSMTVTSTSTGEQVTIRSPNFTVTIAPNGAISVKRTDPGRLAAVVKTLKGRSGASGGATTTPNQNSQQAQVITTSNSGLPPGGFFTGSFTPSLSLTQIQNFTTQLISNTAQTVATGADLTGGIPVLPSGNYTGGILVPLAAGNTGNNLPLGLGGVTFPTITYTETLSDGSSQTITRGSNNFVTLVNGIPQNFNTAESFNQTSTSNGNFSEVDGIVAGIRGGQVTDLGGDLYVQVGRLTGPAAATFFSFDNITSGGMSFPFSQGPFSGTLPAGLSAPYVIGVPATNVPTIYSGPIVYNMIAATKPVFADGSGSPGTFTGTLSFAFGQSAAAILQGMDSTSASITSISPTLHGFAVGFSGTITMPGDASYQLSTIGGLSNPAAQIAALMANNSSSPLAGTIVGINEFGATFRGSPLVVVQGLSRACPSGTTCTAALIGTLAGPGGSRAGILYAIGNFSTTGGSFNLSQLIIGTAAFRH